MMWGALILFLGVTTTADAETIDMFFSGGGIRATFGTLIAMCEMLAYWEGIGNKTFKVDNLVGLSGGAWGVSILGATDLNPCVLVERAKVLPSWGEVHAFRSIRCKKAGRESCFRGWRNDIETWFDQILQTDRKQIVDEETGVDLNMKVPTGFGNTVYGTDFSRVWIQTDPCHFTGMSHKARGDGACIAGANELQLYCVRDITTNRSSLPHEEFHTNVADCLVADGQTELTYNDLLAFSSAAWASATAVNGAVQFAVVTHVAGDKRSPEVTCGTDMNSALCDAGGECNLPLGAIDVMYLRPDLFTATIREISQFVSFDYSDNGGDMIKSINQCVEKWSRTNKWDVLGNKEMPWGYSLLLKGSAGALHHHFVLHVVVFRGATKAHNLVKSFPTVSGTEPNYFTPKKAVLVAREYGDFLAADFFGAIVNPFNTPASEFKRLIIGQHITPPRKKTFLQRLGALIPG